MYRVSSSVILSRLSSWKRRVAIGAIGVGGVLVILAIILAACPWGMFKGVIEDRLSRRFGRTVTITSIDRIDGIGFHPVLRLRGVRIPQPAWAGPGDLAIVDDATVGFLALPLLRGKFKARELVIGQARLALVRTRDGRRNWTETEDRGGPGGRRLSMLRIDRAIVSYRDAKQDRDIRVVLRSNDRDGLRIAGQGTIRGAAVRIAAQGASIVSTGDGRWPFAARIDGPALRMRATGSMAAPLDTSAMTLDVTASADDLKLIDAVVEAGLFRTQPVTLASHVVRDGDRWRLTGLHGRIGRSDFAGTLTVAKADGRTKLDGDITARQLDFADLSSDEGLAQAAAMKRALGPRVVPDTRIDIGKIRTTDGRIAFRIGRIVSRDGPSSILAARGTMTLDRQRLTAGLTRVAMRQGAIAGRIVVDQRGGVPVPRVTIDLRLADSRIAAIAGGGGSVDGRLDARVRLTGRGDTIRQAVAASTGRIGLAAREGSLPARIANALGFDAGRALLSGNDDRADLRCVIVGVDLRGGTGHVAPLILDTSASQMRGTGTIRFPGETLAITLTGAPKRDSVLRLPGSATMTGTISRPDIVVPREVKSIGNIFKAIGRAITGRQGPTASDADCAGLAAHVLR